MATLLASRRLGALLLSFAILLPALQAQTECADDVSLAQGYTTSITSVTDNGNGSYTIVLTVINNGCSGCKKLNSLTVQAAPGTYSNISVQVLSGAFTWASISMGPNLSQTNVTGFRINNTNGIGNGQPASFTVTYTLTGPLQDQQIILKTSAPTLTVPFTAADFQAVQDCLEDLNGSIFPYFDPYANKLYDIIGVELTSLHYAFLNTGSYISDDIFQILGNSVRVTIRTKPGQHANALSTLTGGAYGLVQELNDPANNLVNGTIPILNLLSLNLLTTQLVSARPIYAPLHNAGLITSQGDTSLRSFRARDVFSVDGQGIKVGVLSDSYNTILGNPAADDVLRGDLPGATNPAHPTPVQVLQDYPFGTRSDEGRAMLQIVHDIAPGADLAFRTGFLGPLDFANGIKELQVAGCDVIVDDISYISEPMFRDGVVAQAVDYVKVQGVSYFSAAGNFGTNSWQGTYAPVAAPAGVVGTAHNFKSGFGAGTDILQSIKLYEGDYTVVLQWDDGTAGATTSSDYDIYLASDNGNALFGFNRMNVGGEPIEVLPFVVAADSVMSNIMIVRESGSAAATLKYTVYRGFLKINEYSGLTASTLSGQANAAGAIAVGAVLYTNTPEYGGVPTAASFSSRGGTPVNGVARLKPEIMAPNGVNTSVDLGGVNYDGDLFPNFFGTSAAAPHAGGVAALLLQARTKYYGDVLTPDGVKGVLQNTAVDMHAPGYDVASGAGLILADEALKDLANPAPYIQSIAYDTTLTPGEDTLQLTIYGEYLDEGATVWLDGVPLTNGVLIQGDSAIITIVDPFSALYPAIQVHNPPKPGTNGTDGGLSNPLYFTTKETILISVDNKSKKYGEVLPAFTAVYTLESVDNSVPLASAGLTPAELDRIHDIDLSTIATALNNVGLWGISTDPNDPLSPNSNVPVTDPLDISLLQQFNIVVQPGLLTITPMDLKITPRDTTFVYNDSIAGITFDYLFNDGESGAVPMNAADSITILNAVKSTHGTALVNGLGVVRGTALVNNGGDQLLTDSLLSNLSCMISQSVKTTRGTALVNGELLDPEQFYQFALTSAVTTTSATTVRGTALVNGYPLVRGTALVNHLDSLGNITNTTALVNSAGLVNSSGTMNSSTITLNSNTQTLVILGDADIAILSGDSVGNVDILSVNLITGNTVGTHLTIPGTFITNNFNVSYGIGHATILPDTAVFTIAPSSLTQTYNGGPRTVTVSVVPDSVDYIVTYNGNTTPPVNAGSYAVHVEVDDENYVGFLDATLVIQPAPVQFTITSTSQTYNAGPRTVGVSVVPAGTPYTVTYNGSSTPPVNAGSYAVVVTANSPNYAGTANATLVVAKAPATATTGIYVINKNAPLPAFTATYSGFLAGQTASVVTSVSFSTSPNYTGNAGVYAIVVNATAMNYVFTSINGTLYVNPAGPGTKQVKPNFICKETLSSPGPGGFMYIAHFNYENQNSTPVYLPVGPTNQVTGSGFLATGQPVLFLPGGGTWNVPYNGGTLQWQITSNKNNGTVGAIPANASNTACSSGMIVQEGGTDIEEEGHMGIDQEDGSALDQETGTDAGPVADPNTRVYPNPSTGRVFLEFSEGQPDGTRIEVYNALGAPCKVNVQRIGDQRVELDLSSYGKGMYFIQVINPTGLATHTVVIE